MNTEPTTEMMNEVIGVFDGWIINEPNIYSGRPKLFVKDKYNHKLISEFKYHTSWDWLIPVVRKILHEVNAINTEVGLREALYNCDLKATHKSCYQFITWYNQQKQTNE